MDENRNKSIKFMVTTEEKQQIKEKGINEGFDNISDYIRHHLLSETQIGIKPEDMIDIAGKMNQIYAHYYDDAELMDILKYIEKNLWGY